MVFYEVGQRRRTTFELLTLITCSGSNDCNKYRRQKNERRRLALNWELGIRCIRSYRRPPNSKLLAMVARWPICECFMVIRDFWPISFVSSRGSREDNRINIRHNTVRWREDTVTRNFYCVSLPALLFANQWLDTAAYVIMQKVHWSHAGKIVTTHSIAWCFSKNSSCSSYNTSQFHFTLLHITLSAKYTKTTGSDYIQNPESTDFWLSKGHVLQNCNVWSIYSNKPT